MQADVATRADLPGGSARDLCRSLQADLALPENTRLFVGHDYGTEELKEPAWESTVKEPREHHKHAGSGVGEEEVVRLREQRDATLDLPDRMLHALHMNLPGGRRPEPEKDGRSHLRIPVNRFRASSTSRWRQEQP